MMTFEERIRRERASMSKSFAKLADYLLDSYIEASFMTASELAHVLNVDAATVVRFSQHLGYKGFPHLQQEIRQKVKYELLLRPKELEGSQSASNIAVSALRELSKDLEQTRNSLDTQALEKLVESIGQAHRIFLVADSPAQPAARLLADLLEEGSFTVYLVGPGVVDLARTLHASTPQDLIIAIETSGLALSLARMLQEAQIRGIPTVAIVGTASLASARYADIVLAAHARPVVVSNVLLVNALVYALSSALRWRFVEEFAGVERSIVELSHFLQQTDGIE